MASTYPRTARLLWRRAVRSEWGNAGPGAAAPPKCLPSAMEDPGLCSPLLLPASPPEVSPAEEMVVRARGGGGRGCGSDPVEKGTLPESQGCTGSLSEVVAGAMESGWGDWEDWEWGALPMAGREAGGRPAWGGEAEGLTGV